MTRTWLSLFIVPMLVCALPALSVAQDADELTASGDRPGFADSTSVVPAGHVQVEAGVGVAIEGDFLGLNLPVGLVRYGLIEQWLELRVHAPDFAVVFPPEGDSVNGSTDFAAGVKSGVLSTDAMAMSVVAGVVIPAGSDEFTQDFWSGFAELNVSAALGDRFGVGGNVIGGLGEAPGGGDDMFWSLGASLAPSVVLTDMISAYAEVFTVRSLGSEWDLGAGAGVVALPVPRLQLDVFATFGLTDAMTDVGLGAGAAYLF